MISWRTPKFLNHVHQLPTSRKLALTLNLIIAAVLLWHVLAEAIPGMLERARHATPGVAAWFYACLLPYLLVTLWLAHRPSRFTHWKTAALLLLSPVAYLTLFIAFVFI